MSTSVPSEMDPTHPLEPMSLEQLRELNETDFEAFRSRFLMLLSRKERLCSNQHRLDYGIDQVILMLKATTATLDDLLVRPAPGDLEFPLNPYRTWGKASQLSHWMRLHRDLFLTKEDDALVIFQALARSLSDRPFQDRLDLMRTALLKEWRLRAIDTVPELFLGCLADHDVIGRTVEDESPPANAFQVLLSITGRDQDAAHASVLAALKALQRAGVVETSHPVDGAVCLHLAAWHPPALFRPFVEVLSDSVNAQKGKAQRPLDLAAASPHPENVKILLDAGADPRPLTEPDSSPLHYAVGYGNLVSAQMLLDTLSYSDADVENSCSRTQDASAIEHVRTYHAALKARNAVDGIGSVENGKIRPL